MYNFITPSLVINVSNNMYSKLNNIINIHYNVYSFSFDLKIFSKILSKIGEIINPFIFFFVPKDEEPLKNSRKYSRNHDAQDCSPLKWQIFAYPYFHLWKRYRWQSITKRVQTRNHRGSYLNRRFWKTFRSSIFLSLSLFHFSRPS